MSNAIAKAGKIEDGLIYRADRAPRDRGMSAEAENTATPHYGVRVWRRSDETENVPSPTPAPVPTANTTPRRRIVTRPVVEMTLPTHPVPPPIVATPAVVVEPVVIETPPAPTPAPTTNASPPPAPERMATPPRQPVATAQPREANRPLAFVRPVGKLHGTVDGRRDPNVSRAKCREAKARKNFARQSQQWKDRLAERVASLDRRVRTLFWSFECPKGLKVPDETYIYPWVVESLIPTATTLGHLEYLEMVLGRLEVEDKKKEMSA